MGLWDRVRGVGPGGYRERAAKRLERQGELAAAVELYLEASLPDEAARVLLLRADAEPKLERRVAFFEQAAITAASEALSKQARARKARLSYDLVKARGGVGRSELYEAATELEAAGEGLLAAEAFASLGDAEGEIRALTSAGAIDRLEERLKRDAADAKEEADESLALRRMQDHDRGAERRAALRLASESGAEGGPIRDLAREIRQRLVRGPLISLVAEGRAMNVALGIEVTIGRGEATIVVGSRALSRVHLKLFRRGAECWVEDNATRNGTLLRGARLGAPLPVGSGLDLKLGGEVPVRIAPDACGGVRVELGADVYIAPLGALGVGGFAVALEGPGGDEASFVTLESSPERPAYRRQLELGRKVELCLGDEISAERGGAPVLTVGVATP